MLIVLLNEPTLFQMVIFLFHTILAVICDTIAKVKVKLVSDFVSVVLMLLICCMVCFALVVGVPCLSLFCYALLCVLPIFAII